MLNTWLCQTQLERLCSVVTSCAYWVTFELSTTPLYGDNNGSLALAANPGGEHQRSKHIDVRYHYVRQQIEEKLIAALKIGTKYQLADFTTKALALPQFMFLALIAMGINSGDEPDP